MRILTSILLLGLTAAPSQAQNVLVVLLDDAGVDKFSIYGAEVGQDDQPPTPNIDALAAAGVRFTNATSNPVCRPSRASLLTGKSAMTTGLGGPNVPLDTNEPTVADVLGSAGYATGLFGKWHLAGAAGPMDHPLHLGFTQTLGTRANPNLAGGSGYYDWVNYVNGVQQFPNETTYSTSYYVDEAIAFIQAQTGSWFAFVSFNAPHFPFEAPPPALHSYSAYAQGQTPTNDQETRDIYAAMIEAVDTEIGRLLAAVNPSNTLIVVLADNGTPPSVIHPVLDSTHSKSTAYEGGVNVPLIVSGAGVPVSSEGLTSDVLVEIGDIFATALEVAGITSVYLPDESQSFAYALTNPAATSLRTTAQGQTFIDMGSTSFIGPRHSSALSNRETCFKVLQHETMPDVELYDLCNDPLEATNLNTPSITPPQEAIRDALAADLDPAAGVTDCTNGIDDDDDGTIDWDDGMNGNPDAGCLGPLDLSERHVGLACDDGYDNDASGLADFRLTPATGDPQCDDPNDTVEGFTACNDGIDNDGDGLTDYDPGVATGDPGCTGIADDSEKEAGLVCDDGLDNDLRGDGADYPADPGCKNPYAATEEPTCQNGLDDDGRGDGIDFDGGLSANGFVDPAGADSRCRYPYTGVEHGGACGLGFEWAAFLGLPALRRRLRRPSGPTATRP